MQREIVSGKPGTMEAVMNEAIHTWSDLSSQCSATATQNKHKTIKA